MNVRVASGDVCSPANPGVAPISSTRSAPPALGLCLRFLLGPQTFSVEPSLPGLAV